MPNYSYKPKMPLAAFVDLFWLYEGFVQPHAKERVLPTGTVELIFNLTEDEFRLFRREKPQEFDIFQGSLLCGTHSEYFIIDTARPVTLLGVHFKPGGVFPFLNLPANQLQNTHLSLETVWGEAAHYWRGKLMEAKTPQAKFQLLEKALLKQAQKPLTRHPAVAFALQEFHSKPQVRTVSEVTNQIGLSQTRFIQVFSQEVGLTPKLFWRIRRFQQVLHLLQNQPQVEWTELALMCGYFDQAHFIHDFRAFSGLNPTTYLSSKVEYPNHVPLPE